MIWRITIVILVTIRCTFASERLEVDFTTEDGHFKPLNGVNKGPLAPGGILDLSTDFSTLKVPFVRLHDCHWPNPDVVDIHAVFPDWQADPKMESSYDFRLTDEYIQAIRACGSQVIYRLGESIEHTSIKRFVHPPKDAEKWAQICLGIIRHYNAGWAGGHAYGIEYWEIWNEPENQPVMWTGTDAQYFDLYATTARAIKREYPNLKIGGPAIGAPGSVKNGQFVPGSFVKQFLRRCREEKLPLDFFSWHCYTDDPRELVTRAKAIRALLDEHGFSKTESHLNEWNYLPGNSWDGASRNAPAQARELFYSRMSGAEGAAFTSEAFILLQDAPLDIATFFHGEAGPFGTFNEHGTPYPVYHALHSFAELREGRRVLAKVPSVIAAIASRKGERGSVLISKRTNGSQNLETVLKFPWSGNSRASILRVTGKSPVTESMKVHEPLQIRIDGPGITFVEFRPEKQ